MTTAHATHETCVGPVATARAKQAVSVEQVDARGSREEIIQLFERNGRRHFRQQFDWYYRDQGQETPLSWVLRDSSGSIRGLCSVTVRPLKFGAQAVRAGIAGNLLVDRNWNAYFGASSLVSAMKSAVLNHQIEVLLGIPNRLAAPVFSRMHFQVIDRWITRVQVFRSREMLGPRFPRAAGIVSPMVDLFAAATRACFPRSHRAGDWFETRGLTATELDALDLTGWSSGKARFSANVSGHYLNWRFLQDPVKHTDLVGIVSPQGRVCGYLALRRVAGRTWVVDCRVDADYISPLEALACYSREAGRNDGSVWVATLRSSPLSRQLAARGFLPVPSAWGGYPDFPLVGFWRADHPLASSFAQAKLWDVWPGLNDV